jgi:hypothetical protein
MMCSTCMYARKSSRFQGAACKQIVHHLQPSQRRRQACKLPCCLAAGYIQGVKCLANTWGSPIAATTAATCSQTHTLCCSSAHAGDMQHDCFRDSACTGFHTQSDTRAPSSFANSPHPVCSTCIVFVSPLPRGLHLWPFKHPEGVSLNTCCCCCCCKVLLAAAKRHKVKLSLLK